MCAREFGSASAVRVRWWLDFSVFAPCSPTHRFEPWSHWRLDRQALIARTFNLLIFECWCDFFTAVTRHRLAADKLREVVVSHWTRMEALAV